MALRDQITYDLFFAVAVRDFVEAPLALVFPRCAIYNSSVRMRILAVCLSVALLSCGLVHKTELVDIPLLTCSGLPCVEVKLDGSASLRLFIDLASNGSYLTAAAAQTAKLPGISEARLRRDESRVPIRPTIATVNRVQAGSLVLHESFFVVDPTNIRSLAYSPRDDLPPGDGSLSYTAFANRLVILDIPHHRLRVSTGPYRRKNICPDCSRLRDARQGCFGTTILATDGFAINGYRTKAVIDPLYPGAVLAVDLIEGVVSLEGTPTTGTYRGDSLLFVRDVSVAFNHHTLSTSAPLVRANAAYDISGRQYDALIGLSLLSHHAFIFDFRNMTMQLADSAGSSSSD